MADEFQTATSSASSPYGWYHHNFYTTSKSCQPDSLAYVVGYNVGKCRQTYDEHRQPNGSLMYRYDENNGVIYAAEYADLKCREPRMKWLKQLRRFVEIETDMRLTECESMEEEVKLYGLPDGDDHSTSASRSVKVTQQQRLPLSGEYAVQLGFDSLQDCRDTRFSNSSHTAQHAVHFKAYATNMTCTSNEQGKYVKYDCSSGSPVLYTFADQYCERVLGIRDVNKLCNANGINSAYTYWTCAQTGLVLPLADTREDEHIVMDGLINIFVMTVVLVHFCMIVWRHVTSRNDEIVELIQLPKNNSWNTHSRMKLSYQSEVNGLNRRIADLQQENESLRSVVASKDQGIKILQNEINENAASLKRIDILENELSIMRSREKHWKELAGSDCSHNAQMKDKMKNDGDDRGTNRHHNHHHGSHGHHKGGNPSPFLHENHTGGVQKVVELSEAQSGKHSTKALEARLQLIREKDRDSVNKSLSSSTFGHESKQKVSLDKSVTSSADTSHGIAIKHATVGDPVEIIGDEK